MVVKTAYAVGTAIVDDDGVHLRRLRSQARTHVTLQSRNDIVCGRSRSRSRSRNRSGGGGRVVVR